MHRIWVLGLMICAFVLGGCRGQGGSGGLPPAPAAAPLPTAAPGALAPAAPGAKIEPDTAQALAAAPPVSAPGASGLAWLPGDRLALAAPAGVTLYTPPGPGLRPQAAPQLAPLPTAPAPGPAALLTAARRAPSLAWVIGERAVFVWSEQTGSVALAEPGAPVTGLALSPAGDRLAYVTFDKTLVRQPVDAAARAQAAPLKLPAWLTNLAYSPDGAQLAGADLQNFRVYFIDAQSGQTLRSLDWPNSPAAALYGAYLSPDWSRVAWVAQGAVQVMDAASGAPGPLLGHADTVSALAWSPDGRLLATASAVNDRGSLSPALILWDPTSGRQAAVLRPAGPALALSFSPDGASLAALGADGALQVWRVAQP